MSFVLFMILLSIILSILVSIKSGNGEAAAITLVLSIFIGMFILGIRVKYINFDNVDTNLRLIVNDTMTNDELISEIKELIIYETDGEITDISTTIKEDKVSNLNVKDVEVKITEPIVTKHLYFSITKEFKIIIKDGEVKNNNVEIVGLKRKN